MLILQLCQVRSERSCIHRCAASVPRRVRRALLFGRDGRHGRPPPLVGLLQVDAGPMNLRDLSR